jgi:hypothetical protein
MMAMGRAIGVVFGVMLASASGCGGDSGPADDFGEPIPTSIPADKHISDLTPAERDQLCTDLGQWAMTGPFLTDGCRATALLTTSLAASQDTSMTDGDLQMICQQLYDACVAGGVTINCSQIPATCTATVGAYDTCLSDSVAALGGLPPCSSVTRASLPSTVARLSSPPNSAACTVLQNKCPGAS